MESPWDYFENRKHKKWEDLTPEELDRLIIAIHIIQDDCGTIPNPDSVIRNYLSYNLPIDTLPMKLNEKD